MKEGEALSKGGETPPPPQSLGRLHIAIHNLGLLGLG